MHTRIRNVHHMVNLYLERHAMRICWHLYHAGVVSLAQMHAAWRLAVCLDDCVVSGCAATALQGLR
jgi:hypothetical protein